MFFHKPEKKYLLCRSDVNHPLSSYSKWQFELDEAQWPSVEHYYQAMKFNDDKLRELVRMADHPEKAKQLAQTNKQMIRADWPKIREVMMTRAVYIKCRSHDAVTKALLDTGDEAIVETSQYDYFWGCGRDGRGHNGFGKVLMAVRDKLREEQRALQAPEIK
jgi:ribA/ribD-fused uncharacterized protein